MRLIEQFALFIWTTWLCKIQERLIKKPKFPSFKLLLKGNNYFPVTFMPLRLLSRSQNARLPHNLIFCRIFIYWSSKNLCSWKHFCWPHVAPPPPPSCATVPPIGECWCTVPPPCSVALPPPLFLAQSVFGSRPEKTCFLYSAVYT